MTAPPGALPTGWTLAGAALQALIGWLLVADMFATALLLVAIQAAPTQSPGSALDLAELEIARLELCASETARHAPIHEALSQRYTRAKLESEAVFGRHSPDYDASPDIVTPCADADVSRYRHAAEQALGQVEAAVRARIGDVRGLWFGPLHLCGGAVESVTATDEHGMTGVIITLAPTMTRALHAATEARVGAPMAIILDGGVLAGPVVREPITGGRIHLIPIEAERIGTIRDAARRPC